MRPPEYEIDKPEAFGLAAFWMMYSLFYTLYADDRLDDDDLGSIARAALMGIDKSGGMLETREQAAVIVTAFLGDLKSVKPE